MTTTTELNKTVDFKSKATEEDIRLLNTSNGAVMMVNTGLVGEKLLNIIQYELEANVYGLQGHGVNSIVFRTDGYPKFNDQTTIGMYYKDVQAIAINLDNCIQNAFEITRGTHSFAMYHSLRLIVWMNIIKGCIHEIHHAQSYLSNRDWTEKNLAKEEKNAQDYSQKRILSLAKEIDMEIDLPEDLNEWITIRFEAAKEELVQMQADSEGEPDGRLKHQLKWMDLQDKMLKKPQMCILSTDPSNPVVFETFKEYLRDQADGQNDPTWDTEVIDLLRSEPNTTTTTTTLEDNTTTPEHDDVPTDRFDDHNNVNPKMSDIAIDNIIKAICVKTEGPLFMGCNYSWKSHAWENLAAMHKENSIELTEVESRRIKQMYSYDGADRATYNQCNGKLFGAIGQNQRMPVFSFTLKTNKGIITRTIVPQDPEEVDSNGGPTACADYLRNEGTLAWVLDENKNRIAQLAGGWQELQ